MGSMRTEQDTSVEWHMIEVDLRLLCLGKYATFTANVEWVARLRKITPFSAYDHCHH